MKLFIAERFLSWKDRSPVTDENDEIKYYVYGDFAIAKQYYVSDADGRELASVVQKKVSSTGTCIITRNGSEVARIVPKITFLKPKYAVKGLDWTIEGNFKQDQYEIKKGGDVIAGVRVRMLTKGSAFEIDIAEGIDEVNVLSAVLIIEGILELSVINTAVQSAVQQS